jgi:hypothetical protein
MGVFSHEAYIYYIFYENRKSSLVILVIILFSLLFKTFFFSFNRVIRVSDPKINKKFKCIKESFYLF